MQRSYILGAGILFRAVTTTPMERTHGKERNMSQPDTDTAAQSPSSQQEPQIQTDGRRSHSEQMNQPAQTSQSESSHDGKDEHALHTNLKRGMESRHLQMISLGGVIGTGLFLSSGYTIQQAGPIGTILAYSIGALIVYLVMLTLGELSVAMPYAGSFHMYAKRFIGPGTAFTIAILYWLNWAVALASEFTAAGLLMQRWFPHSPSWVWSAVFIVVVFAHGMVAGQGAADSCAIRQDEYPWCAGVGRAVQHGGFAAGAAVFRARRLDRVIWCWSQYPVWRRWWCGSPCACAISVSGVNGRGTGTAPMSSTTVRPVSRCCRGWPS